MARARIGGHTLYMEEIGGREEETKDVHHLRTDQTKEGKQKVLLICGRWTSGVSTVSFSHSIARLGSGAGSFLHSFILSRRTFFKTLSGAGSGCLLLPGAGGVYRRRRYKIKNSHQNNNLLHQG